MHLCERFSGLLLRFFLSFGYRNRVLRLDCSARQLDQCPPAEWEPGHAVGGRLQYPALEPWLNDFCLAWVSDICVGAIAQRSPRLSLVLPCLHARTHTRYVPSAPWPSSTPAVYCFPSPFLFQPLDFARLLDVGLGMNVFSSVSRLCSLVAASAPGWFHRRPGTALPIQPRSCIVQRSLAIALFFRESFGRRMVWFS
jgi:hypothetical protein